MNKNVVALFLGFLYFGWCSACPSMSNEDEALNALQQYLMEKVSVGRAVMGLGGRRRIFCGTCGRLKGYMRE